jgi:hypothetical protein
MIGLKYITFYVFIIKFVGNDADSCVLFIMTYGRGVNGSKNKVRTTIKLCFIGHVAWDAPKSLFLRTVSYNIFCFVD